MALTAESAARKDRTSGTGTELQHRHFAFIASTLASLRNDLSNAARQATVHRFADDCAASNPRFDRARFLTACAFD